MQCSHCESAPSFASDFAMAVLATSALSVSGPAQRHLSANAARLQGVSPRAPSDASAAPRTLSLASIAVTELASLLQPRLAPSVKPARASTGIAIPAGVDTPVCRLAGKPEDGHLFSFTHA